ncbi:MAG: ParB/RepB/Spo0J family partition protein [Patescibacteria group bacterium]|nr:ParB/RepB/Spo0J family partition protein [Patescibacteria group bacterium]MDE1965627.1 ParB/RepB/Spo0J family partition protein [Patescibacteria group bacterium]
MTDTAYVPTKYDSVYWVETERIKPNPYQPRREFDDDRLKALAESIRQYGVLMPLVVTRKEVQKPDGGLQTEYELIAGERRLRASKLIGLKEVPVVIRTGEQSDKEKLELAIIENLQREDLNAVDRARAFEKLAVEFGMTHAEIGAKVGKSREFVSNSLRLLLLPEPMQAAIVNKEISEGHARTLLALNDRPEERETLFREICLKKISVRAAERIARSIAQERVRKHHKKTPEMQELEKSLTETLGTRVIIEANEQGGRLMIDFFSPEDLSLLVTSLAQREAQSGAGASSGMPVYPNTTQLEDPVPSRAPEEPPEDDLYSIRNFSV